MAVGGAIIVGIITGMVGSTTSKFVIFVSFSKLGSFFKATSNLGLDFERGRDCEREVVDDELLDDEEDEDEDKDLLRDREVCVLLRFVKDVEDDREEDDFDLNLRLRLCECEP